MPRIQNTDGTPNNNHDYFTARARGLSISQSATTPDDFSGWGGPGTKPPESVVPQTPSTPTIGSSGGGGGFIGRIRALGKAKRQTSETGSAMPGKTATDATPAQGEPSVIYPKTPIQVIHSNPLAPPLSAEAPTIPIPANTAVLISEEAPNGYMTVYRGHVSSTGHDAGILEGVMPVWLLEYLLLSKIPAVPVIKISFVLLPYPNDDPDGEQLPELLNTAQAKLTASRFLRVRKLTYHVQEKLEKLAGGKAVMDSPRSSLEARTVSSGTRSIGGGENRVRAEEHFEIMCNDALLPLDMTLAAVRQYVWRSSSELVMHYRRKMASK